MELTADRFPSVIGRLQVVTVQWSVKNRNRLYQQNWNSLIAYGISYLYSLDKTFCSLGWDISDMWITESQGMSQKHQYAVMNCQCCASRDCWITVALRFYDI